jgi:putative ATPase
MSSLFPDEPPDTGRDQTAPLAERMRPRTFDEFVGQQELLAPGMPLREAIERDRLQSIVLWDRPAPARPRANHRRYDARPVCRVQRVLSGSRKPRGDGRRRTPAPRDRQRTIVFIDEIHRFNKAQQDAFLPRVEAGFFLNVRATTENPSFEINAALLSRSKVFVMRGLTTEEIEGIITRALRDPVRGLGGEHVTAEDAALKAIAVYANGDARTALNLLELSVAGAPVVHGERRLDLARINQTIQRRALLYDKSGEEHYNIISALHKSMRNSDPDAAVYLAGAHGGSRRGSALHREAPGAVRVSEDIGNADPRPWTVAVAAKDAVHFIGMPEGNTARAARRSTWRPPPRATRSHEAYNRAAEDAHRDVAEPVPLHLRNAPTRLMKELDYGKGAIATCQRGRCGGGCSCLPPALEGRKLRAERARVRKEIKRRLDGLRRSKKRRRE